MELRYRGTVEQVLPALGPVRPDQLLTVADPGLAAALTARSDFVAVAPVHARGGPPSRVTPSPGTDATATDATATDATATDAGRRAGRGGGRPHRVTGVSGTASGQAGASGQ